MHTWRLCGYVVEGWALSIGYPCGQLGPINSPIIDNKYPRAILGQLVINLSPLTMGRGNRGYRDTFSAMDYVQSFAIS